MKRIICNTKLKKLVISIIIIIMLFGMFLPCRVFALEIQDDMVINGEQVQDVEATVVPELTTGQLMLFWWKKGAQDLFDTAAGLDAHQVTSKEELDKEEQDDWKLDTWQITDKTINWLCTESGLVMQGSQGALQGTYSQTAMEQACLKYNEVLATEKEKGTKLTEAAEAAATEAHYVLEEIEQDATPLDKMLGSVGTSGDTEIVEDEDYSDLGGILLSPFLDLFNTLADAVQTLVTRCMTGEWRWVMVGDNIVNNLTETEAYKGQFKGLQIWGANESSSIEGWPEEINTDELSTIKNTTDEFYRNEKGENDDKSLENNSYFVNASGYAASYKYPQILISPEELFSGKIALVDANFFSTEREEEVASLEEESITSDKTNEAWLKIKGIVQTWFRALRYAGFAALLSVLIYIGIKVMLSSTSRDKSKYKDGIVGWVLSMVIMFLLPYIMSFIFTVSDKIVEIFNSQAEQSISVYSYDGEAGEDSSHEVKMPYTKFTTNLMGLVRFQAQSRNLIKKISYMIMYIMMIVYTVKFSVVYVKRFIYLAFLIILSPIVTVMYAVDKIKGGSSHTFDMWLKEFTFNVLIQPVHMMLYYILVVSAMTFATSNPIYVIVVFGFIRNAEKILKKIFGFGKAQMGTVGGISDTAKNAITYHNLINTVNNVKGIVTKNRTSNASQINRNNSNNNNLIDSSNSSDDGPDYARDFNNGTQAENEEQNEQEQEENTIDDNTQQTEQQENEQQQENNEADSPSESEESQHEEEESQGEAQEQTSQNRFTAAVGTLGAMVNKRKQIAAQRMKHKMSKTTPKKAIKGVFKGALKGAGKLLGEAAKVGASVTVATGAVLGQAAISVAMDGKYTLAEGAGTFAAGIAGTNSLFNKAGKKVSKLSSEYKQIKNGEETVVQQQREKEFWNNRNNIEAYQNVYGEMGNSKLSYELNRGANIAKNGITNVNEQMQVTAFADKLADETFNSQYGKFKTNEERQKAIEEKAKQLRQNGNKDFENMTDEDVIKADIIKERKYDELATNTLKAKKEIPASVRNANKKQRDAWIKGQVAEDKQQADGMKKAIEMTHRMDLAQVDRKQALQKQREQYAKLKKSNNRKNK